MKTLKLNEIDFKEMGLTNLSFEELINIEGGKWPKWVLQALGAATAIIGLCTGNVALVVIGTAVYIGAN